MCKIRWLERTWIWADKFLLWDWSTKWVYDLQVTFATGQMQRRVASMVTGLQPDPSHDKFAHNFGLVGEGREVEGRLEEVVLDAEEV